MAHFAWCDDFAAARNAALARSQADWHLVLDADEWLVEGGPALRTLAAMNPDFVCALRLDDIDAPSGVVYSWLSRLLPGAVRYSGRVHEQPQHQLPVNRVPLVVGHDGYSPLRLAMKQGRNRRLLLAELDQTPDDTYLWYPLGKDHAAYGEHPQAADAFANAVASPRPVAATAWAWAPRQTSGGRATPVRRCAHTGPERTVTRAKPWRQPPRPKAVGFRLRQSSPFTA